MRAAVAAAAALLIGALGGGCPAGDVGTIELELVTSPGSTLLDTITRLRLTLTEPRRVFEIARTDRGFDLSLDLEATGAPSDVILEGFDANDNLVVAGQSPPLPFTAIDLRVVVFVAPPLSIERAPETLAAARRELAAGALPYGAILAGGAAADDAPSAAIAIYNAYDHTLLEGRAMPGARRGVALGVGVRGGVYLFGGRGPDGPTGTLWRFDTTVAPSGSYLELGDFPAAAREGARAVMIGADRFLVTGAPPLELAAARVVARGEHGPLEPSGATVMSPAGAVAAVVLSPAGVMRFRDESLAPIAADARAGGAAAALGKRVVVLGGGDPLSRDALVVDPFADAVTVVPDVLAAGRRFPAVAATSRHVVVAGGVDEAGAPIASAEVLDAATLAPLATIPIAPRTRAFAIALPNDQVLLGGGDDVTDVLELFTPPPPPIE